MVKNSPNILLITADHSRCAWSWDSVTVWWPLATTLSRRKCARKLASAGALGNGLSQYPHWRATTRNEYQGGRVLLQRDSRPPLQVRAFCCSTADPVRHSQRAGRKSQPGYKGFIRRNRCAICADNAVLAYDLCWTHIDSI